MRLLASMLLMIALPALSQVIGQNVQSNPNGTYTLTAGTQLVVETVVVKDKKGNPIDGLTAKDFTITEDGAAQSIRFCEHQSLPQTAMPLPVTPPSQEDVKLFKTLARSQIASEKQSNVKYKDRRLLALYFDMSAMPPSDQMRSLAAAQKFIRMQM